MSGEFERIARYLAPLAADRPEAFGLSDDAALLRPPSLGSYVTTLDTMVEGVHYLPDDPPELIARKLLRVNLSDLAAMGAAPYGYLLSLCLPGERDDAWLAAFCEGLRRDQEAFGIRLLGGDSVSTKGPPVLSLCAIGEAEEDTLFRRSGAQAGDLLFVSGTVGDGVLGLGARRREFLWLASDERDYLTKRYQLPEPRLALATALRGVATAAIDVSDGLLADAGHLAETSGVAIEISGPRVPLSNAAQSILAEDPELFISLLGGGDDYELLFAAPLEARPAVLAAAEASATPVTEIGRVAAGEGVSLLDRAGEAVSVDREGWTHF